MKFTVIFRPCEKTGKQASIVVSSIVKAKEMQIEMEKLGLKINEDYRIVREYDFLADER